MKEQPDMFAKVTQLPSDAQVVYLLASSEKIIQKLSGSDGYEKAGSFKSMLRLGGDKKGFRGFSLCIFGYH
jgi:hypothetical protein